MLRVVGGLCVLAMTASQPASSPLQGHWVVTSIPGMELPPGTHSGLNVDGDKYEGVTGAKVNERGTMKVNASARPLTVDMNITEGSDAGKVQLGIADITGDTLKIALGEPGATARPTDFSGSNVLTLTKLKPLAKELEGTWQGTVVAGGQTLRVAYKLANGADGLAIGTLVSIDQNNSELPIAAVVQMGPTHLRLIVVAARGTFDGDLKAGEISGTWSQPGGSAPLVLKKQ